MKRLVAVLAYIGLCRAAATRDEFSVSVLCDIIEMANAALDMRGWDTINTGSVVADTNIPWAASPQVGSFPNKMRSSVDVTGIF